MIMEKLYRYFDYHENKEIILISTNEVRLPKEENIIFFLMEIL
jgi:hypothetical protein